MEKRELIRGSFVVVQKIIFVHILYDFPDYRPLSGIDYITEESKL